MVEVFEPASTQDIGRRVSVTSRLVVYHQIVRLGDKLLETHDQNFHFPTEHLRL
jgi:hypothetical protein